MKTLIAKEKVALTQDGKTLVAYESEQANSLFAAEGVKKTSEELKPFANASKFFSEEDEKAEEKAPAKRVAAEPEATHTKAAKIVKK